MAYPNPVTSWRRGKWGLSPPRPVPLSPVPTPQGKRGLLCSSSPRACSWLLASTFRLVTPDSLSPPLCHSLSHTLPVFLLPSSCDSGRGKCLPKRGCGDPLSSMGGDGRSASCLPQLPEKTQPSELGFPGRLNSALLTFLFYSSTSWSILETLGEVERLSDLSPASVSDPGQGLV